MVQAQLEHILKTTENFKKIVVCYGAAFREIYEGEEFTSDSFTLYVEKPYGKMCIDIASIISIEIYYNSSDKQADEDIKFLD